MTQIIHPLSIHDLTGSGQGNVAGPDGWACEVRTPLGPVYRAASRRACERWARHRDVWLTKGRPFDYKSRFLDHGEGQLVFDNPGAPYGLQFVGTSP